MVRKKVGKINWIKTKLFGSKDDKEEEKSEENNKDLGNPRQFIYLDELSVESLLASKGEGGITSQTTRESTAETSEEVRGEVNASISGVGSNISGSRLERDTQRTASVNHFNLVQSQFTRLHNTKKIPFRKLEDGDNIEDLDRGEIIELEANISVNKLYRTWKTFDYLDDIFPNQIGEDHQVRGIMEKLSSLFEDSIPIVGEATSLELEEDNQINSSTDPENALTFVGDISQDLLWTDPANSLYGEEKFKVVFRVKSVKENKDTRSLKISEIMSPLMPKTSKSLEKDMRNAIRALEAQLAEFDAINAEEEGSYLKSYSEKLQEKYTDLGDKEEELMREALQRLGNTGNQSEKQRKKKLTEEFTELYEEDTGSEVTPDDRIKIRKDIEDRFSPSESNDESIGKVIESEIIAIYW